MPEVRRSGIHGKGVFATSDYGVGDKIGEWPVLAVDDAATAALQAYVFETPDGNVLCMGAGAFINNSDQPNSKILYSREADTLFAVAVRRIKAGTELTIDYETDCV